MEQNKDHIKLAKEAAKTLPHKVYVAPNLPKKPKKSWETKNMSKG